MGSASKPQVTSEERNKFENPDSWWPSLGSPSESESPEEGLGNLYFTPVLLMVRQVIQQTGSPIISITWEVFESQTSSLPTGGSNGQRSGLACWLLNLF